MEYINEATEQVALTYENDRETITTIDDAITGHHLLPKTSWFAEKAAP